MFNERELTENEWYLFGPIVEAFREGNRELERLQRLLDLARGDDRG